MGTYKTSDFRKGLKVQIDGEPYLMIEMNFVKPGKGNALYKCRLRNLLRNTVLDRTYKGGDTLETADVQETEVQYLYRQVVSIEELDKNGGTAATVPIKMLRPSKTGLLNKGTWNKCVQARARTSSRLSHRTLIAPSRTACPYSPESAYMDSICPWFTPSMLNRKSPRLGKLL